MKVDTTPRPALEAESNLSYSYVPLLQRVLHTVPPTIPEWGVIATCSLFPVIVVELVKLAQRIATGRQANAQ